MRDPDQLPWFIKPWFVYPFAIAGGLLYGLIRHFTEQ